MNAFRPVHHSQGFAGSQAACLDGDWIDALPRLPYQEGRYSALRGTVIGAALCMPFWAAVVALGCWIVG